MKSTIVWIVKSGGDWICPALEVGSSEFFKHEDKYHVLNWGEWQAKLYEKATGRIKFPALSGENEIARNMKVQLGDKAINRLKLSPNRTGTFLLNVYNIRFVNVPSRGDNYGIYFGYVFANGEWASVCTQMVNKNFSSPVQNTMSWSNSNVLKYKSEFHYPENPFMTGEEAQSKESLSPTIPDFSLTGMDSSEFKKSFRALYEQVGGRLSERIVEPVYNPISPTDWTQIVIDDPLHSPIEEPMRWFSERNGGVPFAGFNAIAPIVQESDDEDDFINDEENYDDDED